MSKQAVEQMLLVAKSDQALQQKLQSANGLAEAVQIGAKNGYIFNEEDVSSVLAERGTKIGSEGEMSEEALEVVAGGWFQGNNTNVTVNGVKVGFPDVKKSFPKGFPF